MAAPIRKLWPLYKESSRPALLSAALRFETRYAHVSGVPVLVTKGGPGLSFVRCAIYRMMASTGQREVVVFPRYTFTPCLNGSVLLCLILNCTIVGLLWLSRARSLRFRWTEGSYASAEGTVNSPTQRKPKNPAHAAAQSTIRSGLWGSPSHTLCSDSMMSIVISSLVRETDPACALAHFAPASTYYKRGIWPFA